MININEIIFFMYVFYILFIGVALIITWRLRNIEPLKSRDYFSSVLVCIGIWGFLSTTIFSSNLSCWLGDFAFSVGLSFLYIPLMFRIWRFYTKCVKAKKINTNRINESRDSFCMKPIRKYASSSLNAYLLDTDRYPKTLLICCIVGLIITVTPIFTGAVPGVCHEDGCFFCSMGITLAIILSCIFAFLFGRKINDIYWISNEFKAVCGTLFSSMIAITVYNILFKDNVSLEEDKMIISLLLYGPLAIVVFVMFGIPILKVYTNLRKGYKKIDEEDVENVGEVEKMLTSENKKKWNEFKKYCMSGLTNEHPEFLEMIHSLKKCVKHKKYFYIDNIMAKFIGKTVDDIPTAGINLPSDIRNDIISAYGDFIKEEDDDDDDDFIKEDDEDDDENGKIDKLLLALDKARKSVRSMLEVDIYVRYKISKI